MLLVRSGELERALEMLAPRTARGYGFLLERAAREPALLALLDRAPEWRSSGGDAGCTRWSSAEPVRTPRTVWRRRIDDVHGAFALAVDRGRAFVAALGPRGTELVALSVKSGDVLWRFPLGNGIPAAPLAREGRVYIAAREEATLRTWALTADGAEIWRTENDADRNSYPGALNLHGGTLVLPVAPTWRGVSRAPDDAQRAFLFECDAETGRDFRRHGLQQVFLEVATRRGVLYVAATSVGSGFTTVLTRSAEAPLTVHVPRSTSMPHFMAAPGGDDPESGSLVTAMGGELRILRNEVDFSSSVGGAITSLAVASDRLVVGRGAEFAVRDTSKGETLASWSTSESPLLYLPRVRSHPILGTGPVPLPCPRSAVCAGDLCYLASPLSPSISAYDVKTGTVAWRHAIEGLLVPEEGPRFTWPVSEVAPPDRGPLHLAPLPGRLLGITLSGYAFLIEG